MSKIKIGIIGYGNLGRGVEYAIAQQQDMELVAIFTRRGPSSVTPVNPRVSVYHVDEVAQFVDKIDVMILCGGSATDLPEQTPAFTKLFNTVDSFDTHAKVPEHFAAVDDVAQANNKVSVISVGWDPGLFSINRVLAEAVLPEGESYTFWGKGVSQGHSDAIRRIEGVLDAKQYTIPVESAIDAVRQGTQPNLSTRQKHKRECFVVAADDANRQQIEQAIVTMPNYFDEYDTVVHFVTQAELDEQHAGLPHGGFVIRSGKTGEASNEIMEFSLKLDSNPEFTASVLVSYARAAHRLAVKGEYGAKTVFDIPLGLLSQHSAETLREQFL
ncbi:diaminopimelate dehydrogenase [Aerococcaceae bacterium zg-ZUI334]|uniref:diaminopimelate dehydrogenase n=1 Tax=Aerococcaceae bacterium zg-252 TaxID=2796928 RepID=UPI001B8F1D97|nr:diaminopimelate dehydrogenase [Aerococcaceae bacterium zg-ZUI334]